MPDPPALTPLLTFPGAPDRAPPTTDVMAPGQPIAAPATTPDGRPSPLDRSTSDLSIHITRPVQPHRRGPRADASDHIESRPAGNRRQCVHLRPMQTDSRPGALNLEQSTSRALQSPAYPTLRWPTWHRRSHITPTHPSRVCHMYQRVDTPSRGLQCGLGGRDVHGGQHDRL